MGKLTDASWLLTMEELVLDTGHELGEQWDVTEEGYTIHYIASEPYGFDGMDWTALESGAQFILYSPKAAGHEPGTGLYGAVEFQSWMHERREFLSEDDVLGCWGCKIWRQGTDFLRIPTLRNYSEITHDKNLPKCPSAASENLDIARYACDFLLIRA